MSVSQPVYPSQLLQLHDQPLNEREIELPLRIYQTYMSNTNLNSWKIQINECNYTFLVEYISAIHARISIYILIISL